MLKIIFEAIWFILPAYFANSAPVFFYKFFNKYNLNLPIDFGKNVFDGKRLFGDGKTWNGLAVGILAGSLTGYMQGSAIIGLVLGAGALFGDLIKSFFKRRLGIERGKLWFPFDQIDFILGAFLFASFVTKINLVYLAILLIITPLLHLATNLIGFKLKLKKEPW